jgi:hypothetical protein
MYFVFILICGFYLNSHAESVKKTEFNILGYSEGQVGTGTVDAVKGNVFIDSNLSKKIGGKSLVRADLNLGFGGSSLWAYSGAFRAISVGGWSRAVLPGASMSRPIAWRRIWGWRS